MLFLVSNVNKAFKVECPSLEASVDFNISRCEDEKNTVVALQNEILMVKKLSLPFSQCTNYKF